MFEAGGGVVPTAALAEMVAGLARLDAGVGDAERIDQIRVLEELKAAAAAAQARVVAAFAASQHAAQLAAGVPAARVGRGVAAQVGLARRQSPYQAARYTGWCRILVAELPATLAALGRGQTSEWRAMLVARETARLSREHRAAVDAALAGRLGTLGDRAVEAAARQAASRLDPAGQLARLRAAEADRRVSLRPAPDVMTRLSALLSAAQGVAVYAALHAAAEAGRAGGDPRGRGQLMADTLVQRATGQAAAGAIPVEINLIMTDPSLFNLDGAAAGDTPRPGDPGEAGGSGDVAGSADLAQRVPRDSHRAAADAGRDEPAQLLGYGPIPAELARRLIRPTGDAVDSEDGGTVDSASGAAEAAEAEVWVRRLYRHPHSGQLVGMDSARRCFPPGLRRFLVLRDRTCRTLYCDASIRHLDHAVPAEIGGPTTADNGQGTCETCNYAKQAPGWTATPMPAGNSGAGHTVITTTPTGHTYPSTAPDPPGANSPVTATTPPPPARERHMTAASRGSEPHRVVRRSVTPPRLRRGHRRCRRTASPRPPPGRPD